MRAWKPLAFLLIVAPAHLPAQAPAPAAPAASYEPRYQELRRIRPSDQVAQVSGLILPRDAAEIKLDSGSVAWLTPVGGRTVAAVFTGRGTFGFAPPAGIERERLKLFRKTERMEEPYTWAVLLFADTTLDELLAQKLGVFSSWRV